MIVIPFHFAVSTLSPGEIESGIALHSKTEKKERKKRN